jgi:hypothetical protein
LVWAVDAQRLVDGARKSCCRESYLVLGRNRVVRIGVGARLEGADRPITFIDVSIDLCPGGPSLDTGLLERGIALAKGLKALGYEMECLEGVLSCEKSFPAERMDKELLAVRHLLGELELHTD